MTNYYMNNHSLRRKINKITRKTRQSTYFKGPFIFSFRHFFFVAFNDLRRTVNRNRVQILWKSVEIREKQKVMIVIVAIITYSPSAQMGVDCFLTEEILYNTLAPTNWKKFLIEFWVPWIFFVGKEMNIQGVIRRL